MKTYHSVQSKDINQMVLHQPHPHDLRNWSRTTKFCTESAPTVKARGSVWDRRVWIAQQLSKVSRLLFYVIRIEIT